MIVHDHVEAALRILLLKKFRASGEAIRGTLKYFPGFFMIFMIFRIFRAPGLLCEQKKKVIKMHFAAGSP